MRPTLQTTLRATCLAAALVAGLSAHAATPAEMQTIKLYGDVTIAQDSVKAWGPWEQFEAPAAGNPPVLPSFRSDASSLYRPIGPVNPPNPTPATEGAIAGFGTFAAYDYSCECEGAWYGTDQAKLAVTYSLTNATETSAPSYVSGTLTPHLFTENLALTSTGRLDFDGFGYSSADGKISVIPLSVPGIDSDAIQAWAFIMDYARGTSGETVARSSESGYTMLGVIGVRTSDADIAALRAGNFTASYQGITLINGFDFGMNMAFGTGDFTQTYHNTNAGADFIIGGKANGASLSASQNVEVGGGTFQMSVNGFFTGKMAAGYIGNVAVVSTGETPASLGFADTVIAQKVVPEVVAQPTSIKAATKSFIRTRTTN